MKILNTTQIRAWDAYTIQHTPIESLALMEKAAMAFTNWFSAIYDVKKNVIVVCGTGNNGGDGMAVARLLYYMGYEVQVIICNISILESTDFQENKKRLPSNIKRQVIATDAIFPTIAVESIIIDALLGSGLTRPIEGFWANFIAYINNLPNEILSIDIPSGLFADRVTEGGAVIRAHRVLSFEVPKLAFFMPQNEIAHFDFVSIGLLPNFLETVETPFQYITKSLIKNIYKPRKKFSHKGTFGHALLMVGSRGMVGAAVLSAKACLRSGVGLLSVHSVNHAREVIQTAVPEAIFLGDSHNKLLTEVFDLHRFSAVGIGCGLGKDSLTAMVVKQTLEMYGKPLVIDADAINLISTYPAWLNSIPPLSILTPHPKEFERLFGKTNNDFERLDLLRQKSQQLNVIILLKGAHTAVACPDGSVFFNSTGNAGMATGGSGDVLTGIITGLLAQGYTPQEAAIFGVWLHGKAGDLVAQHIGQESIIASDLIEYLGKSFMCI